jgi:hypothetical protein
MNIIFLHDKEPKPTLRAQSSPLFFFIKGRQFGLIDDAFLCETNSIIHKINALEIDSLKPSS